MIINLEKSGYFGENFVVETIRRGGYSLPPFLPLHNPSFQGSVACLCIELAFREYKKGIERGIELFRRFLPDQFNEVSLVVDASYFRPNNSSPQTGLREFYRRLRGVTKTPSLIVAPMLIDRYIEECLSAQKGGEFHQGDDGEGGYYAGNIR